jgi:hypothetical protein
MVVLAQATAPPQAYVAAVPPALPRGYAPLPPGAVSAPVEGGARPSWSIQSAGRPWSVSRARRFDCTRFEVRPGDAPPGDVGRQPPRDRAEISGHPVGYLAFDQPYWQAMDILLEPPVPAASDSPRPRHAQNYFVQWHNTNNPGDRFAGGPNLAFSIDGDTWAVETNGLRVGDKGAHRTVYSQPLELGRFHHFVVRMTFSQKPDGGAVTVWVDGRMVYDGQGLAMGYAGDRVGVYPKTGVYRIRTDEIRAVQVCNLTNPTPQDLSARIPPSGWLRTPGA